MRVSIVIVIKVTLVIGRTVTTDWYCSDHSGKPIQYKPVKCYDLPCFHCLFALRCSSSALALYICFCTIPLVHTFAPSIALLPAGCWSGSLEGAQWAFVHFLYFCICVIVYLLLYPALHYCTGGISSPAGWWSGSLEETQWALNQRQCPPTCAISLHSRGENCQKSAPSLPPTQKC